MTGSGHRLHLGASAVAFLLVTTPAVAQESCEDWATVDFFREATAETVQACIDAGADVNVAIRGGTHCMSRPSTTGIPRSSRCCSRPARM